MYEVIEKSEPTLALKFEELSLPLFEWSGGGMDPIEPSEILAIKLFLTCFFPGLATTLPASS